MNVFTILRDAWFFYSRNLPSIVRLCLPLIVLESVARLMIEHWLGKNALPAQELLTGILFYPLYVGALILFLDARSRGHDPGVREVWARALPLWPALAVLAALGTLLIVLGASLFVLPALWVMVKIAFAEYLLVLRGLTPLEALKQSFLLTRGYFLLILGCMLAVLLPVWLLEVWLAMQFWGDSTPPAGLAILVDGCVGLVQLLATVVVFRCYMLCGEPAISQDGQG
ncbi:YciC family protein [Stutzerimonas stutzeri]|uniref:YciC family protein n=1 Tax=Stutzerimonas stutzeri TaxID=316 RepID=UPI0015E3072D|nr:hypothetical protein [Stutzerimonas stutzeri]